MGRKTTNRLGETKENKFGRKMTIIEYNSSIDIVVKFDNDYKVTTTYQNFKSGSISNPYDKTICGMGYIGEGKYDVSVDCKMTLPYVYWFDMVKRCYSEKYHKKQPTYGDKSVCEEWLCFQNFAEWFYNNYYEVEGERMQLDKDILFKNNKVYSPQNCIFVPQRINCLFLKRQNCRGEYPLGVGYHKSSKKFSARCNMLTKPKYLGLYDTPEKAFYEGYKPFKEAYIKTVAEEYVGRIPFKLYEAMYRYVVEIDD